MVARIFTPFNPGVMETRLFPLTIDDFDNNPADGVIILAEIRAQVQSGNVTWDVVDVEKQDLTGGCDIAATGTISLDGTVGAIGGLAAITAGGIMDSYGLPAWFAVVGGLACGAACGATNGIIVSRTGLNAFIVTIATSSVFLGLTLGLTSAQPYYDLDPGFTSFGQARASFFPLMGFISLATLGALAVFYYRTLVGRQLLAIGGNIAAARTAGIPVGRRIVWAHVISGLLAGGAGVLWAAQLSAAQPMIGQSWLLLSFAVPIIGGVSLTGGRGSIIGTVLGALIFGDRLQQAVQVVQGVAGEVHLRGQLEIAALCDLEVNVRRPAPGLGPGAGRRGTGGGGPVAETGPPPTKKKAQSAGRTDSAYPDVATEPSAFVANPHKTPDMNARMTVP